MPFAFVSGIHVKRNLMFFVACEQKGKESGETVSFDRDGACLC